MIDVQKAVIMNRDKYLTLLRSKTAKFFPDHWDFPRGKLEPNEKPIDGIIREVKEETNLDIVPDNVVGQYTMEIKGIPHRFTIYSVKSFFGKIMLTHEHQEYKWLTKKEICVILK